MIRRLDDGWCWIATDDEPTDAVVHSVCVRGESRAYNAHASGCEPTRKAAEAALAAAAYNRRIKCLYWHGAE